MSSELVGFALQIVGFTVGVLTLLDWSLTKKQKAALTGWAETAWLWLSDQKAQGYLALIVSERTQRAIAFVLAALFLSTAVTLLTSYPEMKTSDPEFAQGVLFLLMPTYVGSLAYIVFFHSRVSKRLVANASFPKFGLRLLGMTMLLWLASVPITLVFASVASSLPTSVSPNSIFLLALAPTAIVTSPILVYVFLLGIWIVWFFLISLLTIAFRAAAFVMLRIASYEKGPVLGISTLLVALGLVVNALRSG